jgi:hypothetical protein
MTVTPYRVVYQGIGGPNSMYSGLRCFIEYKSVEDFEARKTESRDIVIAQGVTLTEAKRLCNDVPGKTIARAAFDNGLNDGEMRMHVMNAILAAQSINDLEGFFNELDNIVKGAALLAVVLKKE